MPAAVPSGVTARKGQVVAVTIGVDPHKGSHTAVAPGADKAMLGQARVRASAVQAERLLTWATAWPERTWAVEGAGGLGHLLAQDDHAAVLKIWAKRHRDLSRTRNQVACRLHAALCELVPGGVSKELYAAHAAQILEEAEPCGAVAQARAELAAELVADLRHVDALLRETKKKLAVAVRASGTTLTEVFGVGPAIAATAIGDVSDVSLFRGRDRFAAYNGTAPIEVSSGNRKVHRLSLRGNRRLNHAIHMAAITQIRYQHSKGRAYYDKKIAEGKTPKEALRALKRQISDAIYRHLKADATRAAGRGHSRLGVRRQRPPPVPLCQPDRAALGGPCPHPAGERPCDGRWAARHAA